MSFAAAEAAWDDSCLAGSVKARGARGHRREAGLLATLPKRPGRGSLQARQQPGGPGVPGRHLLQRQQGLLRPPRLLQHLRRGVLRWWCGRAPAAAGQLVGKEGGASALQSPLQGRQKGVTHW